MTDDYDRFVTVARCDANGIPQNKKYAIHETQAWCIFAYERSKNENLRRLRSAETKGEAKASDYYTCPGP